MSDEPKDNGRVQIIRAVQTPLGFFTLLVLVVEVILGVLTSKATGIDFTILVLGMVGLLFVLVLIVARVIQKNPEALTGGRRKEPKTEVTTAGLRGSNKDLMFLRDLFPREITKAIEQDARQHEADHIRIACAHTVWSCRPDLAKPILEDAKYDWAESVRDHAKGILRRFFYR